MSNPNSGYHDCPCRDCFEIAIGGTRKRPSLCNACERAGCSADEDSRCDAPHAYNGHCGNVACCGPIHPAIDSSVDEHSGTDNWYAACPLCNADRS